MARRFTINKDLSFGLTAGFVSSARLFVKEAGIREKTLQELLKCLQEISSTAEGPDGLLKLDFFLIIVGRYHTHLYLLFFV